MLMEKIMLESEKEELKETVDKEDGRKQKRERNFSRNDGWKYTPSKNQ